MPVYAQVTLPVPTPFLRTLANRRLTGESLGRKLKLTQDVHGKIVASLRLGASLHVAAEAAGIGRSTLHRWQQPGEAGSARFRDFWDDVRRSRAEARVAAEHEVWKTNPLAWLRYGPGRERPGEPGWTDGSKMEVSGPSEQPVTVKLIIECPPEPPAGDGDAEEPGRGR